MNNFQKEFALGIFLDDDCVTTVNRLIMTIANIVNENNENLSKFSQIVKKEFNQASLDIAKELGECFPITHRIKGYYEQTINSLSHDDYFDRFKMRKTTVQALINFLEGFIKPGNISLDKKVHVFLCLLTSDGSYSDVGRLYGLHRSSVSYIFHEIASQLTEQRFNFINWPSIEEQHITRIKVNSKFKFPNCVGFIDACRLKVGSKQNKKDKSEIILLQAVCDESLMFIDIHIGEIGKTRKNRVFKESQLSKELKNFIEFDNHLLGDSQYKLRKNLMTPFTSEEVLTSEEMRFNEVHWKTRSYIGHAFELLKEKFRRLNHIDMVKPESIHLLISSACVLHNFVLLHEGCLEVKEEPVICIDPISMNPNIIQTAIEKRQYLCDYINYIERDDDQPL